MLNLTKIIKQTTGLSIMEFCEKELDTKYGSLNVRIKNNSLYPAEIVYIVYRTQRSVKELFGKEWHQLLINSAGRKNISEKVQEIIAKMSKEEEAQISWLLGFEGNKEREGERHEVKEVKDQIVKHPMLPSEATPTPPEEESPLKKLFVKTY